MEKRHNMFRRWYGLGIIILAVLALGSLGADGVVPLLAQVISPTPYRVSIPSDAPLPTVGVVETPRPTATPTEEGAPQIEAKAEGGLVNLRAAPDLNAEIVGRLPYGERFTITGRYYNWLQIRFEPSPSHIAYVYYALVNIIGDEAKIPDLTILPTADDPAARATETGAAILQTPGGELTATAAARVLVDAPAGAIGSENTEIVAGGILPTFTYPPNLIAQAPTLITQVAESPTASSGGVDLTTSGGIAPIALIGILGGLGLMGLAISTLQRK